MGQHGLRHCQLTARGGVEVQMEVQPSDPCCALGRSMTVESTHRRHRSRLRLLVVPIAAGCNSRWCGAAGRSLRPIHRLRGLKLHHRGAPRPSMVPLRRACPHGRLQRAETGGCSELSNRVLMWSRGDGWGGHAGARFGVPHTRHCMPKTHGIQNARPSEAQLQAQAAQALFYSL